MARDSTFTLKNGPLVPSVARASEFGTCLPRAAPPVCLQPAACKTLVRASRNLSAASRARHVTPKAVKQVHAAAGFACHARLKNTYRSCQQLLTVLDTSEIVASARANLMLCLKRDMNKLLVTSCNNISERVICVEFFESFESDWILADVDSSLFMLFCGHLMMRLTRTTMD